MRTLGFTPAPSQATEQLGEAADILGVELKDVGEMMRNFIIDASLGDNDVAVLPSVHPRSMLGLILQTSKSKDSKLTKKVGLRLFTSLKQMGQIRKRFKPESFERSWIPALAMVNTPSALNTLPDNKLSEYLTDNREAIKNMPGTIQDMIEGWI